jgi:pimeloyl-ACP methyl ester carboxylesterase
MSMSFLPADASTRTTVVALHCSGGGAGQWRSLQAALPDCEVIAPEHYGGERGPWTGEHAFTLADEARQTFDLIDANDRRVHLVGHSYGGAVALRVALERPGRVASLSLYEPCVFHVLPDMGDAGARALAELRHVAGRVMQGVTDGAYARAAEAFVDYWSGSGAWGVLRPSSRASVIRWVPKAPLDFHATLLPAHGVAEYEGVRCPVVIMCGEHAPQSTRLIAEALAMKLPGSRLEVVKDAGHMGPVTHAAVVNRIIAAHIGRHDAPQRERPDRTGSDPDPGRERDHGDFVATT